MNKDIISPNQSNKTPYFITNQERLLSEIFQNIIPTAAGLDFLVGFFYFSGFLEIYRKLDIKDHHLRILIGLDAEKALIGKIRQFEWLEDTIQSRSDIRTNFYHTLVTLFNDTAYFDSPTKKEAFKLFLEKLKNGTLELRKTLKPNHAKLYLFHNKPKFLQNGEFPGTAITGSSNLSHEGLLGRIDLHFISRDRSHFEEASLIFETLWKESVALADKTTIDDFYNHVVEKIWIDKLPKPFLIYVRVLEEYFRKPEANILGLPSEQTGGQYLNLRYQIDAVVRALDVIKRHNGVIIADVVGLGKSIIASSVARNLGLKTIIITPPHLRGDWEDYRFQFGYNARVYTSGMIENALIENGDVSDHLIIIDEAHKYRNELTRDYVLLHQLCQRNKVMLLTATPFNNRPQDIFSLVKLFQIPSRSTLQTVDNLSWHFQTLVLEYKQIRESQKKKLESGEVTKNRVRQVADRIRGMLSPLVIRRSRLDLEAIEEYKNDLIKQGITFPKVNPPKPLDYYMGALSSLYEKTLHRLAPENEHGGFIGARYMPVNYLKNIEAYRERVSKDLGLDENLLKEVQINLAKFMKKLLVRRFESSMAAFQSTLISIIHSTEEAMAWYERLDKVPIYKKGGLPDVSSLEQAIGEELDAEIKEIHLEEQLVEYRGKGLQLIDRKELKKTFFDDMRQDLALLKDIKEEWFGKSFPPDPKLERLKEKLSSSLAEEPERKIVIFTEFADTANYLFKKLSSSFRVFKYTASDSSQANKKIIKENFDAGYKDQKNDYDVLIATDAISEGYNLHRAGTIFNYDIPYNPTRVIQRVGRINRINKKVFDQLFIYNFFPTEIGERETGIKQISTLKIAMIHALFGEDTKVLTDDEELESFFSNEFREALAAQEELSPECRFENFIRRLRSANPEAVEEALKLPKRVRIRREKKQDRKGVIIFARKGSEYAFRLIDESNQEPMAIQASEALSVFEANVNENASPTSPSFDELYEKAINQLFVRKSQAPMNRSRTDTLNRIRVLIEGLPAEKDYLEDLLYVFKKLDSLPERHRKAIRSINLNSVQEDFEKFKKDVPHDYLSAIINREKQITESPEDLILSEELA